MAGTEKRTNKRKRRRETKRKRLPKRLRKPRERRKAAKTNNGKLPEAADKAPPYGAIGHLAASPVSMTLAS